MKQEEILQYMLDEKKTLKMRIEDWEKKAGCSSLNVKEVLRQKKGTMGLKYAIQLLDAMDLELTIQDKGAKWSSNHEAVLRLPKYMYSGQRIEARQHIAANGFDPKVDLYLTVEDALHFVTKPCDIYTIESCDLWRDKFQVEEHPLAPIYHYHDHIPAHAMDSCVKFE